MSHRKKVKITLGHPNSYLFYFQNSAIMQESAPSKYMVRDKTNTKVIIFIFDSDLVWRIKLIIIFVKIRVVC